MASVRPKHQSSHISAIRDSQYGQRTKVLVSLIASGLVVLSFLPSSTDSAAAVGVPHPSPAAPDDASHRYNDDARSNDVNHEQQLYEQRSDQQATQSNGVGTAGVPSLGSYLDGPIHNIGKNILLDLESSSVLD
jgi:hypothetical protein